MRLLEWFSRKFEPDAEQLAAELPKRISETPIPQDPPRAGDWIFLANYNESLIDKEWKLAGDRANLMVATQAFLITAFVLMLNASEERRRIAMIVLTVIPALGALIVLAASFGILAAVKVARRLEHERSYYQGVLRRIFKADIPDLGTNRPGTWVMRWSRVLGTAPFLLITAVLFLLWVSAAILVQFVV